MSAYTLPVHDGNKYYCLKAIGQAWKCQKTKK